MGQVVFTRLACQHHIFCGRKQEEKNDYCSISPKEVLLLLTVGYVGPQWFVPPVIINFLLIRDYLYVFEWQWIGSSFPLIPFSLTPRFPGHPSKDVRKSTLARWTECFCWNTRKVRVGCVYHCFSSWWWQLQTTSWMSGLWLFGTVQSNTPAFQWPTAWPHPPIWLYSPMQNPDYHRSYKTMNQLMSVSWSGLSNASKVDSLQKWPS